MKSEFACPIDGCDASFFTEKGLDFHMVGSHNESEKPKGETKVKPKVKVKKEAKPPAKKAKKQSKRVSKLNKLAKLRFEPANLTEGQKISKSNLAALFPHDPEISKHYTGKGRVVKTVSELLVDRTYIIKAANETRGGFMRYIVESKRVRIGWVEGPVPQMKKKYHISYPNVIRLDW